MRYTLGCIAECEETGTKGSRIIAGSSRNTFIIILTATSSRGLASLSSAEYSFEGNLREVASNSISVTEKSVGDQVYID